jgi:hypothetical protein
MKVKPLHFTKRYSQWVSQTPWGTRLYLVENEKPNGDNTWYWAYELHNANAFPPAKVWSKKCGSMEEAERMAGLWYEMMVRSCLDDQ